VSLVIGFVGEWVFRSIIVLNVGDGHNHFCITRKRRHTRWNIFYSFQVEYPKTEDIVLIKEIGGTLEGRIVLKFN
jgi:hypothetical protein